MPQFYSDPAREPDPHALPDCEVFYMSAKSIISAEWTDGDGDLMMPGWYYWCCFPGCLPDSEPCGPYASEQEAIDAAREE